MRQNLVEHELRSGTTVYLLAQGRLVGQVAAEASPAAVMDLSFGGLALSARYLLEHAGELAPIVARRPAAIDDRIASSSYGRWACGSTCFPRVSNHARSVAAWDARRVAAA